MANVKKDEMDWALREVREKVYDEYTLLYQQLLKKQKQERVELRALYDAKVTKEQDKLKESTKEVVNG